MASDAYQFPVAISRLSEGETSREPQNMRAIKWLLEQPGRSVAVVPPQKQFPGDSLKRLISQPGVVVHLSWRGLSTGSLSGRRVLYAWPDRQHFDGLWDAEADALVVIEWNESETAEWIENANPVQLLRGETVLRAAAPVVPETREPLPNGVDGILEHIVAMAAGYSSGRKWNEEDKLKADMMNRPDRWPRSGESRSARSVESWACGPTTSTRSSGSFSGARTAGGSTCRAPTGRSTSTDLSWRSLPLT